MLRGRFGSDIALTVRTSGDTTAFVCVVSAPRASAATGGAGPGMPCNLEHTLPTAGLAHTSSSS